MNAVKKRNKLWVAFVSLLLIGAMVYRFANASEETLIPFTELAHISEFGYKAILLGYAAKFVPFFLVAIFLPFAFPEVNRVYKSAVVGAVAGMLLVLPKLILPGGAIDLEEWFLAVAGFAAGFSVYAILLSLSKKSKRPQLPKKTGIAGALVLLLLYVGCMGILMVDSGTEFVPLNIYVPDQALPQDLNCSAKLDGFASNAMVYKAVTLDPNEELVRLQKALAMEGTPQVEEGIATLKTAGKELTVNATGEWSYYDEMAAAMSLGQAPLEEAQALEKAQDAIGQLLTGANETVKTLVERSDATGEERDGLTTVYYDTRVDSKRIRGSGEITVQIGANGALVSIHKFSADFGNYKTVPIISARDALELIEAGNVAHTLFTPASSAVLTSCEIGYWQEEVKGFLQPIWLFSGTAQLQSGETKDFEVFVPAMK